MIIIDVKKYTGVTTATIELVVALPSFLSSYFAFSSTSVLCPEVLGSGLAASRLAGDHTRTNPSANPFGCRRGSQPCAPIHPKQSPFPPGRFRRGHCPQDRIHFPDVPGTWPRLRFPASHQKRRHRASSRQTGSAQQENRAAQAQLGLARILLCWGNRHVPNLHYVRCSYACRSVQETRAKFVLGEKMIQSQGRLKTEVKDHSTPAMLQRA